ncbi:MAG: hypothetical protein ACYDAD_04555 [Acidimicrobiales bacterium]
MTIVVLLILALIWAAVLIPPYLRNRVDARPADSIGAFRRQLHVLQRTRPRFGAGVAPWVSMAHPEGRRPALADSLDGLHRAGPARGVDPIVAATRRRTSFSVAATRVRAQRRRRDVFVFLLVAMGVSLLLGFAFPVMFLVHGLVDVLLLAYVALLVRMRNLAAEREMKVRFLPGSSAGLEPALLRRSAN